MPPSSRTGVTQTLYPYTFEWLPDILNKLKQRIRIAVIYGGDKDSQGAVIYPTHNPRTWKSYKTVAEDIAQALRNVDFEYVQTFPDDMRLAHHLKAAGIHLAWLNTGGVQGYNPMSHAPGLLEMLGIPYVGHNPLNVSILDNKHIFKLGLQSLGIPTAPFVVWHPFSGETITEIITRTSPYFRRYEGPVVLKPVSGRASVLVHVAKSLDEAQPIAEKIYLATHNHVLVEPFLPGREYAISVSGYTTCVGGNFIKTRMPFAFSPIERVFEAGEQIFTSMDQKAITNDRAKLITDDELEIKNQLMDLARAVYRGFDLKTLIRLDVRTGADETLYVLEANPKPDLKRPDGKVTSLVFMGLEPLGHTYEDLVQGLLADCLDYLFSYNGQIVQHIWALIH